MRAVCSLGLQGMARRVAPTSERILPPSRQAQRHLSLL